jgi:predicted nucleotidyltransferase
MNTITQFQKEQIIGDVRSHLAATHCSPILIAIYGSHFYGFSSKDSDLDVRVIHVADSKDFFRFSKPSSPLQWQGTGAEYKSYEIEQTMELLYKNNPTMLELITTENLIQDTSLMHKIRKVGIDAISKKAVAPYRGRAVNDFSKFIDDNNPAYYDKHVKKYLYIFNSLLIGTHLLQTGIIEPNLRKHLQTLPQHLVTPIAWLILKKEARDYILQPVDYQRLNAVYKELGERFEGAGAGSGRKGEPLNYDAFNDLLQEIRLSHL